jgi:hypothetical protein
MGSLITNKTNNIPENIMLIYGLKHADKENEMIKTSW